MVKKKVKFFPETKMRVAYKGIVFSLMSEEDTQYVEYPNFVHEEFVEDLFNHLKNLGLIAEFSLDADQENNQKEVNAQEEQVILSDKDNKTKKEEEKVEKDTSQQTQDQKEDSLENEQQPLETKQTKTKRSRKKKTNN